MQRKIKVAIAGVVIDAIHCAKLALERGEAGPPVAPSAYYMKRRPRQSRDGVAREACDAVIDGRSLVLPEELPFAGSMVV